MTDPDLIRANIEVTRNDLSSDVDALADKVSPSSIADRQKERVKGRVRSVRESLVGAAHSASDALPDPGAAGGSAVQTAKGHPLAVGLLAFGVGWLVSSLIPTASAERDLAAGAKEKAAPLVDRAKDAAKDAAEQLREPVQDAVSHVKATATDAAGTVRDEGRSAATEVRETAAERKDDVQDAARGR